MRETGLEEKMGDFWLWVLKKMVKYDLKIEKLKYELDCVGNLIGFKNWKNQDCTRYQKWRLRQETWINLTWGKMSDFD